MHMYGRTDRGRVRASNEDCFLLDTAHGIAVLADGMGGHAAGEIASACAVHGVVEQLRQSGLATSDPDELRALMRAAFDAANRAVCRLADTTKAYRGMGTTLVAAFVRDRQWVVGHVGDSRAYWFSGGRLHQVTRDHSVVQELVDAGRIRDADARQAPNRHLVTRAIGLAEHVCCDVIAGTVTSGDLLLLCSDGLTDMLDDDAIHRHCERVATARLSPRRALHRVVDDLVADALDRGGIDNVTVVGLYVS